MVPEIDVFSCYFRSIHRFHSSRLLSLSLSLFRLKCINVFCKYVICPTISKAAGARAAHLNVHLLFVIGLQVLFREGGWCRRCIRLVAFRQTRRITLRIQWELACESWHSIRQRIVPYHFHARIDAILCKVWSGVIIDFGDSWPRRA